MYSFGAQDKRDILLIKRRDWIACVFLHGWQKGQESRFTEQRGIKADSLFGMDYEQ